jgi:hypothetical protein
MTNLTLIGTIGFAALGVAASVLIPVLRAAVPRPSSVETLGLRSRVGVALRPYVALAVLSLIVALVVAAAAAAAGKPLDTWYAAFLAGYVSDSTLQKLAPSGDGGQNTLFAWRSFRVQHTD